MGNRSLIELTDEALVRDLKSLVARDRATTAALLAHLGEVDARRLYLGAAYPSMFAYCMGELGFSEDVAFKRIRAARAARQFPEILAAIGDGRLTIAAVVLLHPHLRPENASELLHACDGKSKAQVECLLAQRVPQPELVLPSAPIPSSVAPAGWTAPTHSSEPPVAPGPLSLSTTKHAISKPRAVGPDRYTLKLSLTQALHDKLRYAQELLSHQVPSGDTSKILELALDALIAQTEKRRFAATDKPRAPRATGNSNTRHVPAEVRRQVWKRDGGQCTYRSETGRRCPSRSVEFDHAVEFARGGRGTIENIRLRCRAHNQFTAERTFGAGFMQRKRERPRPGPPSP